MGTQSFPFVSEADLRAEFQSALPDSAALREARPVAKAFGHQSFLLTTETGERLILKIARIPAEVVRLRRTAAIVERVLSGGVLTPRILHVAPATPRFGGRPFLVQEFLPGIDGEAAWPDLTDPERRQFLRDFGVAVANLHRISSNQFDEGHLKGSLKSDWASHVHSRLRRMRKDNEKTRAISKSAIDAVALRLEALADRVGNVVRPALVHRDLLLRNTLFNDRTFSALLDFEHARYSDPVMEFVALEAHLFQRFPGSREEFLAGYQTLHPQPYTLQAERYAMCLGLELFGAIPYYQRNGMTRQVEESKSQLRLWLAER